MLSATHPDLSRRWKEKRKSFRKSFLSGTKRQKLMFAPRKRQQCEFSGHLSRDVPANLPACTCQSIGIAQSQTQPYLSCVK